MWAMWIIVASWVPQRSRDADGRGARQPGQSGPPLHPVSGLGDAGLGHLHLRVCADPEREPTHLRPGPEQALPLLLLHPGGLLLPQPRHLHLLPARRAAEHRGDPAGRALFCLPPPGQRQRPGLVPGHHGGHVPAADHRAGARSGWGGGAGGPTRDVPAAAGEGPQVPGCAADVLPTPRAVVPLQPPLPGLQRSQPAVHGAAPRQPVGGGPCLQGAPGSIVLGVGPTHWVGLD